MSEYKALFLSALVGSMALLGFLSGCVSTSYQPSVEYGTIYKKWTQNQKNYEGFSNTMQASVTVYHPELTRHRLQEKAQIYGWDQSKKQQQLNIEVGEEAQNVRAFLAFYTPDRRLNQLLRKDSPWQVYLEWGGVQYPAKITRNKTPPIELRFLNSEMTRWHVAYDLKFDLPTSQLSGQKFGIYIKGPAGQQKFDFQFP